MTLTGLLRIFFRWKWVALAVLVPSLVIGMGVALSKPLRYEAEMTIERKQAKTSSISLTPEFDVTRFTSENERTITVLKSRYMMTEWMKALSVPAGDSKTVEQELKKLTRSLIVKPINFTDLYSIRVQADSPAEAVRRAEALTHAFEAWDTAQVQSETQELTRLLEKRLEALKVELASKRNQVQHYKLSGTLSLSGSLPQSELEADATAKQKLYDELVAELEIAGREIDPNSVRRVRIAIPAVVSERPVHPRSAYILTAILLSVFLTTAAVLVVEWQSPYVFRVGDVLRSIGSSAVVTVPFIAGGFSETKELPNVFGPLLGSIEEVLHAKSAVVIQVISPRDGDGKTTVCRWLSRSVKELGCRPLILSSPDSLETQVEAAKSSHNILLLDLNLPPHGAPGTNLTQVSDITCVVVRSAHTSRSILHILNRQLERFPKQKVFYVLNRWRDPLPSGWRT